MTKKCECGASVARVVVYKKQKADPFTGRQGWTDERASWLCARCPNDLDVERHVVIRVAKLGS